MFTIEDIINTLNQVEVKGKANLDRLLSAILALEFILEAQKHPQTAETPPTEEPIEKE